MGWSNGTYSRVHDWTADEAAAIDIEASRMDAEDDSIAAGINNCLTKDGQNEPTANLPMGTNRHTGVGDAAAKTDYASAADVIDQHLTYYVDSGSANTYAITPSPSLGAYAEGQKVVFRAANANTGASTLNVNTLGAIAIQTNDGNALVGGEIVAGGYYEVVYDANTTPDRFVLVSPISEFRSQLKAKSAAESSSGAALQDDDHMAGWSVVSSKDHKLTAQIFGTHTGGNIKFKLDFSTGTPVGYMWYECFDETGTIAKGVTNDPDGEIAITTMTGSEDFILQIGAAFIPGANATLDFQWSKNAATGSDTTLRSGSWMEVTQTEV